MQTRNLLQSPAVAYFAFVSICFLFINGIIPIERSKPILNTFERYFKGNNKIYKIVSVVEIREALAKAKSKSIIMNIYPVKLSKDAGKSDFALRVFFQDAEGSRQNLGEEIDSSLFKIQSAYYINYLMSKKISDTKIPNGYFIQIDDKFIEKIDAVSLYLTVEKSQMEYYRLTGKATQHGDSAQKVPVLEKNSDSTCKCPPECCSLIVMSQDSTGKCPPECPATNLLLSNTVQKLVYTAYKKNLTYRAYKNK